MYELNTEIKTNGKGYWSNKVKSVKVKYAEFDDDDGMNLKVYFDTETWDVRQDGLIYTDESFLAKLNADLFAAGFKKKVDYSEQGLQGDDYVHLDVL